MKKINAVISKFLKSLWGFLGKYGEETFMVVYWVSMVGIYTAATWGKEISPTVRHTFTTANVAMFWAVMATIRCNMNKRMVSKLLEIQMFQFEWIRLTDTRIEELEKEPWQRS